MRLGAGLAGLGALFAFGLSTRVARAEGVKWIVGSAREISRDASASRDAPVSALIFGPRVGAKGAADLGIANIDLGPIALRPGVDAFFELEHADPGMRGALPLPGLGKGPMLWRGMYRLSLSATALPLGKRLFGARGAIETTIAAGHESDHVTGASFDDAPNVGDLQAGGGGEFLLYELGIRASLGKSAWMFAKLADRAYLRGAIRHAPGGELGIRLFPNQILQPFVSLFGEALLADHTQNQGRNGGFGALLGGVVVKGVMGELMPFVGLEAGNGKGLLINRHELRVVSGIRYTPG